MTSHFPQVPIGHICVINPDVLSDSTDRNYSFHYVELSCVEEGRILLPREKITFGESSPRARRKVQEGDILLSTVRPNLQGFAVVGREHSSAIVSTGFAVLRPNPEVDSNYVYQALFFKPVMKQMMDSVAGSNYPAITASVVSSLLIPLPSLQQQKRIAIILSIWDRGIRQLSDLIAAKLRFKQGLMQQLLTGKRRLYMDGNNSSTSPAKEAAITLGLSATAIEVERGFVGKSYDEGIPALGECPSGWRTRKLRELLSETQRPVVLASEKAYQLVTAKRYRAGIVPREELRGDQIKTSSQFKARSGDFLISRRQIVHGACGLVPESLDGAIVSNEYSCLRVSEELDPMFLEYLTHTKYLQRTFYQSSVGVTVEKMIFRIDHWLKYDIHLPPMDEQRRLVAFLSALDREIVLLDHQQKTLTEQKKGLMQKLLTGQVRVKVAPELKEQGQNHEERVYRSTAYQF